VDGVTQRAIAVERYNHCWHLLEKVGRTKDEDTELLTSAFVSRYYWSLVDGTEQCIIGDWMISRAAAAVGEGDLALRFALLANDHAQEAKASDWLIASTTEGLARAHAASGDLEARDRWITAAELLIETIADSEDRKLIASQLASVPR
jgi:hypothetical protein